MTGYQYVFQNRHALEQTDILKGAGHAHFGNLVRRVGDELAVFADVASGVELLHFAGGMTLRDDLAPHFHIAVGGRVYAGDHVEGRGLARAVGADEGHDLALVHVHAQAVHGDYAAELHGHVFQLQDGLDAIAHFTAPPFCTFLRKRSGSSRVPIMPCRKNSTTIMIIMEKTTRRKPLRSRGTSHVPIICF